VFTLLLAIQAMTVSSQVDSVVVYPYQVQVIRNATVSVSGPGELALTGLPGGLDDNSVRIKAPGIRVGEVQVKRGYLAEPTPEVKRLEQKVKDLEDGLKGLEDEAAVLKAKEDFLNSIKLGAPEIIAKDLQQGKLAAESWRGALSFVGDELVKVKARAVKLARERSDKSDQLDAARKEYGDARSAIENRKEISFDYAADAGTFDLQVSYVISSAAQWSPYYELRAKPGEGKVDVSYFAKLAQRTGEDWNAVKVVLSTMRPSLGETAPQPEPWYLSIFEPSYGQRMKKGMLMAPAPSSGVMDKMEAGYAEEKAAEIQPVETGISLQYAIPGRVSLKSGEAARKLSLKQVGLPAEFQYYALPKVREQAFLTGKLINSSEFVFLAGPGNTYVGDEYTGSTYIGAVAPQESAEVSFGTDERVKVKRELVRSFKSKSGLFAKTEKMNFVYKTTVENYGSKPIDIKVVEQVPVSQQAEIKVTVTRVEPKFLEEDRDKGTYNWKPTIDPRGKFEINLEFTVEYPAGKQISGLY
jgi:uncharacterized protein (TIGR02231 family)